MFHVVAIGTLTALLASAQAPTTTPPRAAPGWTAEVIAEVPKIKHPSVICCAPDGRVFVGEDPMDMGADPTKPSDRVLCFHPDGKVTVFAENLYAVYGIAYIDGKIYVHHVPKFSVFTDDNGVGKDRKDLIATTNPSPVPQGGFNDHIPSNIRLGMDGWLYMSTGDKGIYGAVGTDGSKDEIRGGGILRLRPDGSNLQVYSTGTRNHLDVAINSEDEIFTYDNTDDGLGWNTRVTHMVNGGFYGYPWDYRTRKPYTLWMMTDYGGGSPTGALAYNEDALPEKYRGNLFLCEWGRRQLLRLTVERDGGSYKVVNREDLLSGGQAGGSSEFRPVGIAVAPDGMSLYVTDWNNGGWKRNVSAGRLIKVTYTGGPSLAAPKPDWYVPAAMGKPFEASTASLVAGLKHPAQSVRLVAQRRIAERGAEAVPAVVTVLTDKAAPAFARWSAIWTLDGIDGGKAGRPAIIAALTDADTSVRRQAARQLGTRVAKEAVPELARMLGDSDASIRFQAATALGRIGDKNAVVPLMRALAQADLFARYATFTSLNRIGRADPTAWPLIVKGLGDQEPPIREATEFAIRETFEEPLAAALRDFATDARNPAPGRAAAMTTLANMSHKPTPWNGRWWNTQPARQPKPVGTLDWEGTRIAGKAVQVLLADPNPAVRSASIDAVAVVRDPETTNELISVFSKTTDPAMKGSVLRALAAVKTSPVGAELVAAVLAKPGDNADVLADAIAAAGQIGGPKMIESLARYAEGPASGESLVKAIQQLGELKATAAVQSVARHLKSADTKVRAAAIDALGTIGGSSSVGALAPLMADSQVEVRRAVIAALGDAQNKDAVEPLLKAFADPATRSEVVTALAATPDARAIDAYLDGLGSRTASVREAAKTAIAAIKAEALPAIEARLDKAPPLSPDVVADLQRIYTVTAQVSGWRILGPFARNATPFDPASLDVEKEYADSLGKPTKWKAAVEGRIGRGGFPAGAGVPGAGRGGPAGGGRGGRGGFTPPPPRLNLRNQNLPVAEDVAVFVAAEVESPAAASAEFSAGSDEGLTVWVNGKKAFERLDNKAFPTDGFRFPAEVKAGKNLVVAKINQSSGPWEFIMSWSPPGTGRLFKPAGKATDPAEFVKFALTTTGNPDKGLAVYADLKGAGCVKCHVSGSPGTGGGDVGPSLVGVGAKYNREQLIESVLYPSKLIFDGYHQTRVATADGQVKLGLVRGETSTELTLVDSEGKKIVIKKADIDERRELAQSIMPEGLHAGLTPQDFADLIAYMESLKQKPQGGK